MTEAVPKTRLKRTRTGCFKCRVRRRKCDEGKPSCQRCLDGGFECQYGTRLSFLQKNAKTTTAESSSTPRGAKQSYAKLRFVVPETATKSGVQFQHEENVSTEPGTRLSPSIETATVETETIVPETVVPEVDALSQQHQNQPSHQAQQLQQAHQVPQAQRPSEPQSQPQQLQRQLHPPPPAALISPELENYVTSPRAGPPNHDLQNPGSFTLGISPSNAAYETALDGLLALGHDHYVPPSASAVSQVSANGGFFASPTQTGQQAAFELSDKPQSDVFPNCLHTPQDRAVELLRHYRYNIAPWLDICDSDMTFGLLVPRIAMDSIPLLDSLLSLSLTTLGDHIQLDFPEQTMLPDPNSSDIDMVRNALTFTFIALRRQFITQPTSWLSPSKSVGYETINSASFQEHHPSIALAVSWMMLRLSVSVSLMNGSPVPIPSIVSYEASSPLNGVYRESLKYGREPVLLCAQVLNYCFGGDVPSSPDVIRPTAAQRWKSLSEALQMWYTSRPRDFKPMLEIDDNEQLFPLVLFTNGAAVLANQLYHTAMLLLLQNRPRTLPKEHGRSVYLSPLWHSQRICGISLNNDTRTSWDFSLLASFYLAAKRMTYEPQQHAILRGIDRIGSLTGWNVNALSAQLVHEWQPD
ncbi:hypothetical protein FSARC_4504 [Fusarium sarcochroum]|uniref:Zn(2)-C6 fungal-type domain-containing protein n=1 Tax=Fusarium sarcochroum TaxID=1208366 RepID=A0A8H4XBF9_9HYPO|nr:hypothetical protein FSARC_4504 [Fusarium sarcochroum]